MGLPAAKKGDQIVSPADIHLVQIPTPTGPVTVPLPHPFSGKLTDGLSKNVNIMGKPAATKGSWGKNNPKHVAMGIKFMKEPSNKGTVFLGSFTVKINGKPAARTGDLVMTCNDPIDLPVGKVIASGTVKIGQMKLDTFYQTGWPFFPQIVDNGSRVSDLMYSQDIVESLKILFTTLPGERIAHPLYGCDLIQYMFKPINNSLISDIQNTVRTAIELYEVRIIIVDIIVKVNDEIDHRLDIDIVYTLSATSSRHNMTIPFYIMEGLALQDGGTKSDKQLRSGTRDQSL